MTQEYTLACPPPGENRRSEMYRAIDSWTKAPAMRQLVAVFGGQWDDGWSLTERLSFLEGFSGRWDFRRGVERLDASTVALAHEKQKVILEAAADLGLTITVPPKRKSYDYILVLGGVALSCKLRTDYAAEIVQQNGVTTSAVVLLGALRRIPENERAVADSFAPGSESEFDMLNAAAEAAFRLNEGYVDSAAEATNENLAAIVRCYNRSVPPAIMSLCAPSSDPARRANTEDTYEFLADVVRLQANQSVLICTSQIYNPFHLMGAMRMLALPYDVSVEVVGFPLERAGGSGALRGINNLLQEVRSGTLAAVKLKLSLDLVA